VDLRLKAIEKMYTADANLFHEGNKTSGLEDINNSVTAVLKNLPRDFRFRILKPTVINYNIGRAIWGLGAEGQPAVSTGMDIAHFENGKIKSLYVFLDSQETSE
jgi:hypothetical protein